MEKIPQSRFLFFNIKVTFICFHITVRLIDSSALEVAKLNRTVKNKFLPLVVSVHLDSTLEEGGRVGLKQFSDT